MLGVSLLLFKPEVLKSIDARPPRTIIWIVGTLLIIVVFAFRGLTGIDSR
jgi:hypothetical protein